MCYFFCFKRVTKLLFLYKATGTGKNGCKKLATREGCVFMFLFFVVRV
jgi:hypothetical protein